MPDDSGESGDLPAAAGRIERQQRMMSDWSNSGDVFASILAGLAIGLAGDWLLGTDPWLVVVGVVAGFAVGFWRMYERSKEIVDEALRRQRYDGGRHVNDVSETGDWNGTGFGGWD